MKNNFFRSDLNLNDRWWHRLLFVVFIIIFVVSIIISITKMVDDVQLPKYSKVGMLSDRMSDQVRLIGDLVKFNEKIAVYEHNLYGSYNGGSLYDKNGGWLVQQEYYCSKDISKHLTDVVAKTGVNYFSNSINFVQFSEFDKYLSQNNANCISVNNYNPLDNLETRKKLMWGLEADNMAVWQVSIIKTVFSVLQQIFFIVLGFLVVMSIYYKILLYVIFGAKKDNNNI